jgi:hypothetical protein
MSRRPLKWDEFQRRKIGEIQVKRLLSVAELEPVCMVHTLIISLISISLSPYPFVNIVIYVTLTHKTPNRYIDTDAQVQLAIQIVYVLRVFHFYSLMNRSYPLLFLLQFYLNCAYTK